MSRDATESETDLRRATPMRDHQFALLEDGLGIAQAYLAEQSDADSLTVEGIVRVLQQIVAEGRAALAASEGAGLPAALRELSDAAAPGEWASGGDEVYALDPYDEVGRIYEPPGEGGFDRQEANAAFIVASVNYVRRLISPASDTETPR